MSTLTPAVAYLRMSSDSQTESIKTQRKAVREYATSHRLKLIREYIDEGISGDATDKRTAFRQMRDDASKGEFQVIVCWNSDRFGRFDLLEAGYWIQPLRAAGVRLSTVTEGDIDWNDLTGRLMYGIQQEAKHSFLRDLSKNVNRGKYAKVQAGFWMGGRAPFGYRLAAKGTLEIDEEQAQIVRLVFRLYGQGMATNAVRMELDKRKIAPPRASRWQHKTLTMMVDNILYLGHARWNRTSGAKYSRHVAGVIVTKHGDGKTRINDPSTWLIVRDVFPAIVTQEEFDAAAVVRANVRPCLRGRKSAVPFVFRQILYCGHCGAPMAGAFIRHVGDTAYTCTGWEKFRSCQSNRTYERPLLDLVRDHIRETMLDPKNLAEGKRIALEALSRQPQKQSAATLRTRLTNLNDRLAKAEARLMAVPDDMIAIISKQIRELRQQAESLEIAIKDAIAPKVDPRVVIEKELNRLVSVLRSLLKDVSNDSLNELLRSAFSKITVTSTKPRNSPTITGKYEIDSVVFEAKNAEDLR